MKERDARVGCACTQGLVDLGTSAAVSEIEIEDEPDGQQVLRYMGMRFVSSQFYHVDSMAIECTGQYGRGDWSRCKTNKPCWHGRSLFLYIMGLLRS